MDLVTQGVGNIANSVSIGSMHKLTNSSTARLNWSFESLDNLKKLRMFPGCLNKKSRPNSVRSDWQV